ncbi:hypothetical protein cce_4898 [Crocosphaera subtropica ATCC 51142]|uniref:Uncharacterized protein n=1 Tax=Crocosphaera subtropica (strain ATCC 51142 / BH68) TaxID=43989 RepID=B1X283_CROS5|nr:hypothetical protein cce_4898 [Crocosphaera subtropica ATCC 51142]
MKERFLAIADQWPMIMYPRNPPKKQQGNVC